MAVSLQLDTDTSGLRQRLIAFAASAKHLDPALAAFGKYLLKRFKSPQAGWPPLAQSTLESREQRQAASTEAIRQVQMAKLRTKLKRDVRRAKAKLGPVAQANRYAVLKEFERLLAGGRADNSLLTGEDGAKLAKKLHARIGRAGGKAVSKVLGRLPASSKSMLSKHTLLVGSTVPWAESQNEGLSVGKGAKLPKRTWVELLPGDVDVLVQLVGDFLVWAAAGKGPVSSKYGVVRR